MKIKLLLVILVSTQLTILFPGVAKTDNKNSQNILLSQLDKKPAGKKKNKKSLREEIDELKAKVDELEDLKEQIAILNSKVNTLSALKITGFFDVSISNYKNKPNIFSVGDFELDIENSYKNFQVAAALVFHEDAELRVGFIDYHIFGSRISPRGRLFQDEGLHVQVGKFDIPFGNDWRNYLAADRISVTPPMTTELIMEEGYNDEGVRILLNFISLNITAFMLDGIDDKYSFGGNSFGGRIGLTPFSNPYALKSREIPIFEFGFSYILDVDRNTITAEILYAGDFESKIGPIILRSEYYNREKKAGLNYNGCHITGGLDLNYFSPLPVIFFGRYDKYTSEEITSINNQEKIAKDTLVRFTSGININISNISYLKIEYQNYLSAYDEFKADEYYSKSLYYAQLVITF